MKRAMILALVFAGALGAGAEASPAASRYLVELTIRSGDRTVATPSLLVDTGKSATFMKSDKDYWFKLVARPDAAGTVSVDFDSTFTSPEGMSHYGTTVDLQAGAAPSVITSREMRFTIRARAAD